MIDSALLALPLAILATGPQTRKLDMTPQASWPHVRYALYVTAGDLGDLFATPEARRATLEHFAPLRLQKAYLELATADRPVLPPEEVRAIAADLRGHGLEVAGALIPALRWSPLCYNDPEQMALLEKRSRELAALFDEFIIDDWLFTTCTCERCVAGRGSATWADYRRRLVAQQAKLHILDAAKGVNPRVRVTIKYPNWYEGHAWNGYDVVAQTRQFDAVSIGIETRVHLTQDQHIPICSGYVFQRWLGGIERGKWRSAWLDNYDMKGEPGYYVAQVYQAVLARAPEIILWCAGQLHPSGPSSDVYAPLRDALPDLDRLAGLLSGEARGVPIHMPYGSVGEYNVFGHLGLAGVALAPTPAVPEDSSTAIFTRHSLADPADLAERLVARLRAGRDVVLTLGLYRELRGTEIGRALQIVEEGGTVSSSLFRTSGAGFGSQTTRTAAPITFPRVLLTTWPYSREVAIVEDDGDFGVLLRVKYLNGNVWVLNLPRNLDDLSRLPQPALDRLRTAFRPELGVSLSGPGRVALYPFGTRQYVIENMGDAPAPVALRLDRDGPLAGWRERLHGLALATGLVEEWRGGAGPGKALQVSLTLQPWQVALVEGP
jgi:hypothetical protein